MHDTYETPLNSRYASREMQQIFSPDRKFTTWRKLWVALAESEMEMGLPVTQKQVDELKAHVEDIDYEAARRHEERTRHDVMAHVLAYGDVCPNARGVIHLGATSCYVTDNADILMLRDALTLVREKVLEVIRRLRAFALGIQGPAHARLHAFAAGAAHHGGQARHAVDAGSADGSGRSELRPFFPQTAGQPRRDRHAGELHEALRRRRRKGGRAGKAHRPQGGHGEVLRRFRPDLSAQAGQPRARRALRHRPERLQIRAGPAASAVLPRGGRAVREGADRFLGHGLQAQPHALGAHLRPFPPRDDAWCRTRR